MGGILLIIKLCHVVKYLKKYLKKYLIIPNTLQKYLNTNTNTFVFCASNTNTQKKVFKYIQIQKYLTPCPASSRS